MLWRMRHNRHAWPSMPRNGKDRRMHEPERPSDRRLGWAAIWVVGIVLLVIAVVFIGRNFWHHDVLKEDQQTGENRADDHERSEEHTSELQSLMRISYAVFCLKKKNTN